MLEETLNHSKVKSNIHNEMNDIHITKCKKHDVRYHIYVLRQIRVSQCPAEIEPLINRNLLSRLTHIECLLFCCWSLLVYPDFYLHKYTRGLVPGWNGKIDSDIWTISAPIFTGVKSLKFGLSIFRSQSPSSRSRFKTEKHVWNLKSNLKRR